MANNLWTFKLLDEEHTVEFYQEGFLGSKLVIKLDGKALEKTQLTVELKKTSIEYYFNIGNSRCLLRTLSEIRHWDLYVDGRLIY
jgi:hypothetical protein